MQAHLVQRDQRILVGRVEFAVHLGARLNEGLAGRYPRVGVSGLHIERARQAVHLTVRSHASAKSCPRTEKGLKPVASPLAVCPDRLPMICAPEPVHQRSAVSGDAGNPARFSPPTNEKARQWLTGQGRKAGWIHRKAERASAWCPSYPRSVFLSGNRWRRLSCFGVRVQAPLTDKSCQGALLHCRVSQNWYRGTPQALICSSFVQRQRIGRSSHCTTSSSQGACTDCRIASTARWSASITSFM